MAIAHGGAWDLASAPYDSNAAIGNAYDLGCDGVKIDVRVTADDVPVIAHSSPIEFYESLDCGGRRIEEMTADQVTACHRLPSLTERFQRLDEVLGYLRDKMVVQLCVKRSTDIQRTISEIHAQAAEDFAFIELDPGDLESLVPTLTGADTVWYLVNIGSNLAEVDRLLDVVRNPRAFMFEFDPDVDVSTLAPDRLHPAGVRSFTYDSATPLSVAAIRSYFEHGYDVVSSQSAANAVEARQAVNSARGVSPP
jgi:glycerophosphoryl diester phosphodiesterase